MKHAAIGTDGLRAVVWGLGGTANDALHDAEREAFAASVDPGIIGTIEITDERAARVGAGDIDASDLVERTRPGTGVDGLRVKVNAS